MRDTAKFYDTSQRCACGAEIHGYHVTVCRRCKSAQARKFDAMHNALEAGYDVIGEMVNDRYHRAYMADLRSKHKAHAKKKAARSS